MNNNEIIEIVKAQFANLPYDKDIAIRMWYFINTFLPDSEKNGTRTEQILAACV